MQQVKFDPDLSLLVPSDSIRGEDQEETEELKAMLQEAKEFASAFRWCGAVLDSYMGIGVGGVVAVFLLHIRPSQTDADNWIWVIVGDVPPAYITLDNAQNAACALDAYIAEMQAWLSAVRTGGATGDVIPVSAPPTLENTQELEERLGFLRNNVLSYFKDELSVRKSKSKGRSDN